MCCTYWWNILAINGYSAFSSGNWSYHCCSVVPGDRSILFSSSIKSCMCPCEATTSYQMVPLDVHFFSYFITGSSSLISIPFLFLWPTVGHLCPDIIQFLWDAELGFYLLPLESPSSHLLPRSFHFFLHQAKILLKLQIYPPHHSPVGHKLWTVVQGGRS